MHLTDSDIAEKLVDIQCLVYEHFGINGVPNDPQLIQEMQEWATDQLRKTSWLDMVSLNAVLCADEKYNAHFIAEIAMEACGLEDRYAE